jgi:hypothetical protein
MLLLDHKSQHSGRSTNKKMRKKKKRLKDEENKQCTNEILTKIVLQIFIGNINLSVTDQLGLTPLNMAFTTCLQHDC